MGFYAFPFSVRIPMDMPGSLINNQANIKYVLSTYLSNVAEPVQDSMVLPHASCVVNVTEPPRFTAMQQTLTEVVEPKACFCCSQGIAKTDVVYTTNVGKAGDKIVVRILNDNRNCNVDVLNTKLELVSNIYMQSEGGKVHRVR
jgi:hypothetical protein